MPKKPYNKKLEMVNFLKKLFRRGNQNQNVYESLLIDKTYISHDL